MRLPHRHHFSLTFSQSTKRHGVVRCEHFAYLQCLRFRFRMSFKKSYFRENHHPLFFIENDKNECKFFLLAVPCSLFFCFMKRIGIDFWFQDLVCFQTLQLSSSVGYHICYCSSWTTIEWEKWANKMWKEMVDWKGNPMKCIRYWIYRFTSHKIHNCFSFHLNECGFSHALAITFTASVPNAVWCKSNTSKPRKWRFDENHTRSAWTMTCCVCADRFWWLSTRLDSTPEQRKKGKNKFKSGKQTKVFRNFGKYIQWNIGIGLPSFININCQ